VAPLVRLDRRIRPVLSDHCIVGKSPKGSRHVGHQALNTVARIWRESRVRPWRAETFKFSTDPQLAAKVHDVVGLCLHPPGRAVVLCVDHFHAVRLANVVVDQVRRRVQQTTLGHRAANVIRCTAFASCCLWPPSSSPNMDGRGCGLGSPPVTRAPSFCESVSFVT
jgi:hypothetical protein